MLLLVQIATSYVDLALTWALSFACEQKEEVFVRITLLHYVCLSCFNSGVRGECKLQ